MTLSIKVKDYISKLDLNYLNYKFTNAEPKKILDWCVSNIPTGLVQVSNFNIDDLLITDLLYRELSPNQKIPVIFVNSLHHYRETIELTQQAQEIYNLDLKVAQIAQVNSREAFAAKYGEALWVRDRQKYQFLTKTAPLKTALKKTKATAWITSTNLDNELEMSVFARDEQGRLKINPLVYWTRTETWAYAYEYDIIHNSLYDQGHNEIGDQLETQEVEKIKCGIA